LNLKCDFLACLDPECAFAYKCYVCRYGVGVSQSRNCTLRVEVLRETRDPGGGHKFKVVSIHVTPLQTAELRKLTRDHDREAEIIDKYNPNIAGSTFIV
jgi:hypothetical protein